MSLIINSEHDYIYIPKTKREVIEHIIAKKGGTFAYWNKRKVKGLKKFLWAVKMGYKWNVAHLNYIRLLYNPNCMKDYNSLKG